MTDFVSKMDAFINKYCHLYKFSGTLRVSHKGETIYKRHMGFADIEHKIPITDDSVFTIYSMSKPLCAIGFMKLFDRGLVSLDAHPGKYIPEAASLHPDLTYNHILRHVSGLPDFDDFPDLKFKYSSEKPFDIRGLIREIADRCTEDNKPGNERYANMNFALTALAIENVTGMAYADYMEKEVFRPLGMEDTLIDQNGLLIPNRVRGYDINGHRLESVKIDFDYFLGSGDVASTVNDIYALSREMMNHSLLTDTAWENILTTVPGGAYGLGCTVTDWHGKKRITHNGGHNGFRTLHILLPEEKFDIILLSNSGYGNSRYTLSEAVYTAFYGADADEGTTVDMDAGYIRKTEQSGFDYSGFIPKMPDRVPLTPDQEAKVLGDHGYFFMEKDGEDYCIIMRYYQRLCCRHIGGGKFMNTEIDETYFVEI